MHGMVSMIAGKSWGEVGLPGKARNGNTSDIMWPLFVAEAGYNSKVVEAVVK